MGGVQKALLATPDGRETLLGRTLRVGREAGCELVLLGAAELGADAEGVPQLPDFAPDVGPLAGLASLLRAAGDRPALCLACDMPFVTPALLGRLVHEQPDAPVLAPRAAGTGKWEALFARYDAARVTPLLEEALAQGERSFQGLFRRLNVRELALSPQERTALHDWDTPEDMRASR